MIEVRENKDIQKKREFIDQMESFEQFLCGCDGAKFGDDAAPLTHTFGDGLYIREITMPKDMYFTSRIHKTTHPYFVMKGDVTVITENGRVRIKAPYHGMTQKGTKRALLTHEETVWVTVHHTNETDLEKIEKELIAENFDEVEPCLLQ